MICVVSSWLSRASAELRQVDESLAESEGTARRIIDTALDAFIQMDERGRVIEWNPQAEALFGWRRDEAVGQMLADLVVPVAQRAAHTEGLAHFLRTGESAILGRRVEINATHRNGNPITVELTVTAFRRRQSFVFNGFIRDQTQKLATEVSAASGAEDGSGRPARRRHRARLQQSPHRHHRLPMILAERRAQFPRQEAEPDDPEGGGARHRI